MAFIDDVLDNLSKTMVGVLAPFQPNLPPTYPNGSTTAGQIPPTLIAPGRPIQVHVLQRLENHQALVVCYSGKVEKPLPYYDDTEPLNVNGEYLFAVGRSQKEVIVEVWSYDRETRRAIQDRLRAGLGDSLRQTETDSTTTVLRFSNLLEFDDEQNDSVYISQIRYSADFTVLEVPQGSATAAYVITEVDLGATINNQALGLLKVIK